MSTFPDTQPSMSSIANMDEMKTISFPHLPKELAGTVNLMAHPLAGTAAFSALGLGLASHAFGVWMGAVFGAAEASQRLMAAVLDDTRAHPPEDTAKGAPSGSTAPVRESKDAALSVLTPAAEVAALMPEDFRRPRRSERPGVPDDLKQISGIGPKLETVLNELGIWSFDQIAAWKVEEVAWVDDYLSFKGRISRDDWIGQAHALTKAQSEKD